MSPLQQQAITTGWICPSCQGTKQVRKPGDIKAVELLLKVVGALDRNSGPAVHQQVTVKQNFTL